MTPNEKRLQRACFAERNAYNDYWADLTAENGTKWTQAEHELNDASKAVREESNQRNVIEIIREANGDG